MEVTNIINAINVIAEKIFKSIEGEVFKTLDSLLIINEDLMKEEIIKSFVIKGDNAGFAILVMSVVIFLFIYYVIIKLVSMYNGEAIENILSYIFRIIVCVIFSVSFSFVLEQVLYINGLFSDIIANIGKDLTGEKICFENLKEVIVNLDKYMSEEALSIDGIVKGVVSFGASTILISFAIRYVTLIFLIIVAPLAIMFACSNVTYGIFKSWVKIFVSNLCVQHIALVILIIPLAFKGAKSEMFKIILVGSIYLLYKINNFTKDFLGNITEPVVRRK